MIMIGIVLVFRVGRAVWLVLILLAIVPRIMILFILFLLLLLLTTAQANIHGIVV